MHVNYLGSQKGPPNAQTRQLLQAIWVEKFGVTNANILHSELVPHSVTKVTHPSLGFSAKCKRYIIIIIITTTTTTTTTNNIFLTLWQVRPSTTCILAKMQ